MQQTAAKQHLGEIAQLARTGKLDEAALKVAQLRQAGFADPQLAALSGAIEFHRGAFDRAIPLLAEAHDSYPADRTICANLAEAYYRIGDLVAARAVCSAEAASQDPSLRLERLRGFFAQEAEDFAGAVEAYRRVVSIEPQDWSTWNNLGNALNAVGDIPGAVEALRRALELQPQSQAIRINLGNTLFQGGDPLGAEAVLKEAVERDPADLTPLRRLFDQYVKTARDGEALEIIRRAVALNPTDPLLQAEYARQASKENAYAEANAAFEAALELNPVLPEAFVGLAVNFERANQEDLLEPLRERACAADAEPAVIAFIDALRFKRAGKYEEALAALEQAGDIGQSGRNHIHLRGLLLDRLKRHDEAFASFVEMNEAAANHLTQPRERAKIYRDSVNQSLALLNTGWAKTWTPAQANESRRPPVFIGGFPRSGTTLLDTMLMADPNVLVLEEEPLITLMQNEVGGLEALAQMSDEELSDAREVYWRRVAELGDLHPNSLVVDKQPLHTNNVPAIARLFPDAKFILAMRHPCDVLLSCFLTNFRINNAMSNFLDLEDAATLYDLTFTHWEKARGVFDLPVKTVVYERLVMDTPRELRPLFDWLGLDWPGDDLDHREAARARGVVHTASYAQVTEPIYSRAMGRWHNYADHLAPVLEKLRPWVEKYGYSLEDGRIPGWPTEQ